MRFVSFLQRLGYLVFLQVLLLPCLAYSTFHVSLGHNFGFSFASFCYCCSYTYFILVGPFCFGLFVFHSAPGADFVWKEIFLFVSAVRDRSSPGASFVSEKIVWGIRSKTVRLWDPGFCLKPSISVYVRDRLALGACSLFGTNFCWFGSRSRFSFLWNEILLCLRSETVRLREPVLVIYGPGPFSFEGETRRWRCHRCSYFCSQRSSEAGNCLWP